MDTSSERGTERPEKVPVLTTNSLNNNNNNLKKTAPTKDELKLKLTTNKGPFNSNELLTQQSEKIESKKINNVVSNSKKSLGGSILSNNSNDFEIVSNSNPKNAKEAKLQDLMKRKAELRTILQQ